MPEKKSERKGFVLTFSAHFSPHRRGFRLWVAGRQQQLRLVRLQPPGWFFSARPPHKSPFRQALLRQPESLTVINEDTDRSAPPAPEHKQASRERIGLEFLLAQPGQRVDALPVLRFTAKPEICAVHGYAEWWSANPCRTALL
jgi:hypothetical protein